MRGLKHRDAAVFKLQQESHLLQMRGLKPSPGGIAKKLLVASFTDAWIETEAKFDVDGHVLVASFTDAWIETWPASLIDLVS